MSNCIVCGVDPAPASGQAAAVAAHLGRELGCAPLLVHVDSTHEGRGANGVASIAHARELGRMRALADSHDFPDDTTAHVVSGDAAEQLMHISRARDAQLIVVGSRGLRELRGALLGSVSGDLMRDAPCPVVVVPPAAVAPSAAAGIRSIVCGVDGSERDTQLLRLGADLSRRLGAELHAVHAYDSRPVYPGVAAVGPPVLPELRLAAEATLERSLARAGVRARGAVTSQPPASGLRQLAEERDAGLILVAPHRRGKLSSVLRGSATVQLSADGPVPVVVLPPGAELAAGSGHYELASEAA